MNRRRTGVMLLASAGISMVLGVIVLLVGFASSSLELIYVSIGLTVGAPVMALAGAVFLLRSARPHPD